MEQQSLFPCGHGTASPVGNWLLVIYIGTAGWAIPSHYHDMFPGEGSALERYASMLGGVEINSSFHRHHREQTYERWVASVPKRFRFSVKVPRGLTHEGALVPDALVPAADAGPRFAWVGAGERLGLRLWYVRVLP